MGKGQNKGGKKHKRNKNYNIENKALRIKEEGQEYAQITNCKGNCRFDVICSDGKNRAAILCGSMRKRKYVQLNDIVLVSLRDFQDDVCDIIDNYDENNVRKLKEANKSTNVEDIKSAIENLNSVWNTKASSMYQSSKDSPEPDGTPSANKPKGDSKPKDDKKIEDADFEVVEED